MKRGFIKIWRKMLDNPIANKPNYMALWVWLLTLANHKDNKFMWNGEMIIIKEGQLLTGRKELAEKSGIPSSTIERILNFLENEHQIEQQKTNKFRIITILNWGNYQNQTAEWTTNGQQMDTNKNDKNDKNLSAKPRTEREFANLRRKEIGKEPLTPRKATPNQKEALDAFKTGIDYFKQVGYEQQGMMFMEIESKNRNAAVRKLVINAYKALGNLRPLIDWWFSGNGEYANYEPEQCFSGRIIERFKNSSNKKPKKEWWEKQQS